MNRAPAPKALTGRMVFAMLVAFFSVVIGVNLVMMRLAIKTLPVDKVSDPQRKRRFVQEAQSASALNHPNIVTIHDIASDNSVDFIVMELVRGKTLDQSSLAPRPPPQ